MGVNGLTTYLRENRPGVSRTITSPLKGPLNIVVDGWSFIYELYNSSGLRWVYGGEYEEFGKLVQDAAEAWLKIGVQLFFVFDGPYPSLKFSTLTGRVNENVIQPSLLFFRTSAVSRSTPRFLHESRMLPPLCYDACVLALQELSRSNDALQVHFADEEGDPYAVELAGRIGAYVLGNDSDFVVLNSEGYLGYIPMSEVVWSATSSEQDDTRDEDTGDFQVVVNKKGKKKARGDAKSSVGLVPPEEATDLTVSLPVYSPAALANHLQIPATLLPLLGALVGNDYNRSSSTVVNKRDIRSLFFDRRLTASGRITHVATTLQSILSAASSHKRKQKHQVNSVMDLIGRTVSALLLRGPGALSTGEQEEVVEKIVETTLQYAIPRYEGTRPGKEGLWPSDVCALHEPTACPTWEMMSRSLPGLQMDGSEDEAVRVTALYLNAYREGDLSPRALDPVSTGSSWPRIFLENPDLENTARSIGRPIREWCYALLDQGVGLPMRSGSDQEHDDERENDDEDELIDVVEEYSDEEDPLSPLQDALRKLDPSADGSAARLSASSQKKESRSQPKVVTEYVRRGTRLAAEDVTVPSLSSLLGGMPDAKATGPVQLLPEEMRFTLLLHALLSDTPLVRDLERDFLVPVLSVRWVIRRMHARAVENGNGRDRLKEMWTKREAEAFLANFRSSPSSSDQNATKSGDAGDPAIEDRSIQLTAQISAAMEAVMLLSQTLLLGRRVPSPVRRFSGRKFHALLQTHGRMPTADVWEACVDGLDECFTDEKVKKPNRSRKSKDTGRSGDAGSVPRQAAAAVSPSARSSFFNLLADIGAE
ncbi:hypothetical protein GLOTRDRAFT_76344 [Gloeophyllum trabeum ATCC 11539]|uniref:Uncharacterized protein n=1 Tax=Gloeophyllum trabeum (strain ATCC 11539 / FP-39264 / Madison 617) TaxID=670483 RepID=S7Q6A8_GLOTA|nr:uncharacterized protein GLOTRDRAFT_76344 [Gloeophyllum trabeum ATCC 11539]EPQ55032.1 hypothetical protein GLOTRDRAFT_76344 [Gloeophyllum trabeum ATCC 11539]